MLVSSFEGLTYHFGIDAFVPQDRDLGMLAPRELDRRQWQHLERGARRPLCVE